METPPLGKAAARRDADWLREQLVSLAVGCPHTKGSPAGCPLHEVRKLEPSEIIDWVDRLRPDEKEFLMLYHQCCFVINWERDMAPRRRRERNPARAKVSPAATPPTSAA